MTQYSEPNLIVPSLAFLEQAPAGLTTTQLRELLTEALRPGESAREVQSAIGQMAKWAHVATTVMDMMPGGFGMSVVDPHVVDRELTETLARFTEAARADLGTT